MNKAIAPTRRLWRLAALLIFALLVQACAPAADTPAADAPAADAPAADAAAGEMVRNSLGKEMPADAAPLDQQVFVYPYSGWRTFTTVDFFEAVYQRADALTDILSDSLVRLDKNFKANPGAATEWSVDDSGLVWTFVLDPALMWSDGTPVTADDYVATFRYGADPTHAWDFSWYYAGVIKNWTQAVAGEVGVEEIGVAAVDANTLQFTTESPAPFLPAMLVYSAPLQKTALETHGGLYNSDPATSVTAGPYKLVEWTKDVRLVYEINPDYKGTNIPYIEKLIVTNIVQIQQSQDYQGKFVVFRFDDRPFGNGCAGEFGVVPRLDLVGCAIGGEKMGFEIENGFGGGIAFAALGTQKASVPMGAGCSLLIWPILPALVGPLPLNGAGLGSGWCNLGFVVPDPVPSGTYLVQALCSDPRSPLGFTSTKGVERAGP